MGTVIWDGTDDSGRLVQEGIYIMVFEFFDLDGMVKRLKEDIVLVKKYFPDILLARRASNLNNLLAPG